MPAAEAFVQVSVAARTVHLGSHHLNGKHAQSRKLHGSGMRIINIFLLCSALSLLSSVVWVQILSDLSLPCRGALAVAWRCRSVGPNTCWPLHRRHRRSLQQVPHQLARHHWEPGLGVRVACWKTAKGVGMTTRMVGLHRECRGGCSGGTRR